MSTLRFKALEIVQGRKYKVRPVVKENISDDYGMYVFGQKLLRKYLPRDTFKSLNHAVASGEKINRKVADEVAASMKSWALEQGATHYTHWFQPLTGTTAEKHDSFFELRDGEAIEAFSGSSLVQQEPDASSFPHGGIRSTFEARGYTAWDPSSPAFLMRTQAGLTLCIPTVFISYTGESLDYKAPLLKAMHRLEAAAVSVCKLFDKNVKKAHATLGVEQEYFLIDRALFYARPDLVISGRSLFGSKPAKGQQLEDHYFGSIPERVNAFMADLEKDAHKLGIPLRTRHNEVAPAQYECAPNFEEINIAIDHNALLMDLMDKVARRHNFKILLHEKPFAGVNGSGKHCNWSIGTDTGVNLLSPGETPEDNLQFLTFFICTIKAVHEHANLLRGTIASAANDHRLGANEAPPAIISAFIGQQLAHVLNELEGSQAIENTKGASAQKMLLSLPKVPDIRLDNTDRNRTSPFAFTGNKFEFRAVGSSSNPSPSMIALNTIVADRLLKFKDEVDNELGKENNLEQVILKILKRYVSESKNILFEGNNYSDEWKQEALARGLSNIETTPEALDSYVSEETIKLFGENGIFTHRELEARHEIKLETYTKQIQIESRAISELAISQIIPAAINYQNTVLDLYTKQKIAGLEEVGETTRNIAQLLANHIKEIYQNVEEMTEARKKANKLEDARERAMAYCHEVKPYFDKIRYHADKLELYVDDNLWPLPKYRELLFVR